VTPDGNYRPIVLKKAGLISVLLGMLLIFGINLGSPSYRAGDVLTVVITVVVFFAPEFSIIDAHRPPHGFLMAGATAWGVLLALFLGQLSGTVSLLTRRETWILAGLLVVISVGLFRAALIVRSARSDSGSDGMWGLTWLLGRRG
jgi:hypothetical protein